MVNSIIAQSSAERFLRSPASPNPLPADVTKRPHPSRVRQGNPQQIGAPISGHGIVPGGGECAEDRHVGFIWPLAAGEPSAPLLDAPAARGRHGRRFGARAIDVLPQLLTGRDPDERMPTIGDEQVLARGRAVDIGLPTPEPPPGGHPQPLAVDRGAGAEDALGAGCTPSRGSAARACRARRRQGDRVAVGVSTTLAERPGKYTPSHSGWACEQHRC